MNDELSLRHVFLMCLAWFSFFIYEAGPFIIKAFEHSEELNKEYYIPITEEYRAKLYSEIESIQNVALKDIEKNHYSPKRCAKDVHFILAKFDTLRRAYPPRFVSLHPTLFAQEYLRHNGPDTYTRYRHELDKIEGKDTDAYIDWKELLLGTIPFFMRVWLVTFLVICIKRFPFRNVTLGDIVSMPLYASVLFYGAARYQKNNWIQDLFQSALAKYRRQHGSKGRHAIMAYAFALYVVFGSVSTLVFSTAAMVVNIAAKAAIITAVSEVPLTSNHTSSASSRERELVGVICKITRDVLEWLKKLIKNVLVFMILIGSLNIFHARLLWYLHIRPIRAVTLRWFARARGINAPPEVICLIRRITKQITNGEHNEKDSFSYIGFAVA